MHSYQNRSTFNSSHYTDRLFYISEAGDSRTPQFDRMEGRPTRTLMTMGQSFKSVIIAYMHSADHVSEGGYVETLKSRLTWSEGAYECTLYEPRQRCFR